MHLTGRVVDLRVTIGPQRHDDQVRTRSVRAAKFRFDAKGVVVTSDE